MSTFNSNFRPRLISIYIYHLILGLSVSHARVFPKRFWLCQMFFAGKNWLSNGALLLRTHERNTNSPKVKACPIVQADFVYIFITSGGPIRKSNVSDGVPLDESTSISLIDLRIPRPPAPSAGWLGTCCRCQPVTSSGSLPLEGIFYAPRELLVKQEWIEGQTWSRCFREVGFTMTALHMGDFWQIHSISFIACSYCLPVYIQDTWKYCTYSSMHLALISFFA